MEFRIHAGNLKTGSTSIQMFLKQNLAVLNASGGVYIPCFSRNPAAHATLARQLSDNMEPGEYSGWDAVAAELAAQALIDTPILLTNEIFIRVRAQLLKDRLDSMFDHDTHIYFYLRPHIEMITASYLQDTKTGFLARRLPNIFEKLVKRREIDFCPVIEEFIRVFGASRVHCREYHREHFPERDVVKDIPSFFDLPVLGNPELTVPTRARNVSPGAETTALLLHLRQYFPANLQGEKYLHARDQVFLPLNIALESLLKNSQVTPFLPSAWIQGRVKEMFEPGRRAFARQHTMTALSDKWLDEPVRIPEHPKDPPMDLVQTAFSRVIERLDAQGGPYVALLTNVRDTLPRGSAGGVPVVELDALRPL